MWFVHDCFGHFITSEQLLQFACPKNTVCNHSKITSFILMCVLQHISVFSFLIRFDIE